MPVVLKPFYFASDGFTVESLVPGDNRDFGASTDGLVTEGFVDLDPMEPPAEPSPEPEPTPEPTPEPEPEPVIEAVPEPVVEPEPETLPVEPVTQDLLPVEPVKKRGK